MVIQIPYLTGLRYFIVNGTSAKLISSIRPLNKRENDILIFTFLVRLSEPKNDFNLSKIFALFKMLTVEMFII